MTENPGLTEVKRIVSELEDEVRDLKTVISGSPLDKEHSVLTRLSATEREQRDLKRVVEGFERAEVQREDARVAREKKRDRFQQIALGLLATIIGGVVIQVIILYINGVIGG